jgi:hypothetical protein
MALHKCVDSCNKSQVSYQRISNKRSVRKRIPCASPWLLEAPTSLHLKGLEMDNRVLEDIKCYALQRLQREYGYCGIAESDEFAMLNSGEDGEQITIKLKSERED